MGLARPARPARIVGVGQDGASAGRLTRSFELPGWTKPGPTNRKLRHRRPRWRLDPAATQQGRQTLMTSALTSAGEGRVGLAAAAAACRDHRTSVLGIRLVRRRLQLHDHGLWLSEELPAEGASFTADPGLFRPAERGSQVTNEEAVDPHCADDQGCGHSVGAGQVLGEQHRVQSVRAVVDQPRPPRPRCRTA